MNMERYPKVIFISAIPTYTSSSLIPSFFIRE